MDRSKVLRASLAGSAVLVFGIVTAIYGYYRDDNSMDFEAITHATDGAILHAVLWSIVAGIVFLYQLFRKTED
jgi:hypothetical protein